MEAGAASSIVRVAAAAALPAPPRAQGHKGEQSGRKERQAGRQH